MQVREKLWTKYFILTFICSLFTGIANNMFMTALPLYAIHLGGDNSISGLLFGLFMFTAILFRPLFGTLSDDKSRKIVLIIGLIIGVLISVSYLAAISIGLLLFLRSLHGIGFSATTNASGTIISDILPGSRLAEGVGYFGLSITLATAVGPALSIFIISAFNYDVLFLVASFIGVFALFCGLFVDYEKKEPFATHKSSVTKAKRTVAEVMFEKSALPAALVTAFIFLAMGSIMTFIPIYAISLGIEDVGLYFIVYSIALLSTRIAGGKLADKYNETLVVIPGMILMTLSFVILAYATSISGFIISGVLYGLGLGFVDPILNAIMIRLCPPTRRGAGNSTLFTAKDIGGGVGAVIWGFISMNVGFRPVYLFCALSIVLAFAAYHFILRKQMKKIKKANGSIAPSA